MEWHRRSAPDVQHRLLQPARDVQLVPVAQVRAQRLGRHHAVLEQLQQVSTAISGHKHPKQTMLVTPE
jgi:hypothetical protein